MGKVVEVPVLKQWHRTKTNRDVIESKECRIGHCLRRNDADCSMTSTAHIIKGFKGE